MIPVPSIEAVPSEIREGAVPLTGKLDFQFDGWLDEAFGVEALKDPARMPSQCLEEAGYQLSAGFRPGDSDRVKRAKLVSAVESNLVRGLWLASIKPTVEARSGSTASLVNQIGSDDFVLAGTVDESTYTWSVLGGIEAGEAFGIRLASGAPDGIDIESIIRGVFLIDTGNSAMADAEVAALVEDLLDLIPAYYKAYLGYVAAGVFVPYASGEVN